MLNTNSLSEKNISCNKAMKPVYFIDGLNAYQPRFLYFGNTIHNIFNQSPKDQ